MTDDLTCDICKTPFTPHPTRPRHVRPKRFCSMRCRRRAEYQRRKERLAMMPVVVDNPVAADRDGWPVEPRP